MASTDSFESGTYPDVNCNLLCRKMKIARSPRGLGNPASESYLGSYGYLK